MCLSKFTHIGTVIPRLSLLKINVVEKEWETFIRLNGSLMVDTKMRYPYIFIELLTRTFHENGHEKGQRILNTDTSL